MDIFNGGKMGSKIVVTTRDERVAKIMQTCHPIHYLKPLDNDDCWTLLAKHAFKASNYQQQSNLEVIGKEIADKCKGLPLAAAALGCLLRIDLSQDYWNGVLKSSIWEMTDEYLQPAMLLSYRYLPSPLKGCFAYCSIFPKNSIFEKREVVQLWIAVGLVHDQPRSEKVWEKLGEEYFDELVSRSLIHRRSVDGKEYFEMHDLMNDLATMVSSPYCIRLDEQKLDERMGRVRHLSHNRGEYDSYNKFEKLCGLKGLRTFLPLPLQEAWTYRNVQDKVVRDLLPSMNRLRVLSLSHYRNIAELPKIIGNLIYLRYLNLSHTNIERLPSETCKLYNLQTLLLSSCYNLTKLPEEIGKLVNLRHLDIRGTRLREMPVQIAKLENLQTLSDFFVSEERDGLKVAELGKFPHLQGKLSISKLENVTNPYDASQANLKAKEHIGELALKWSRTTSDSQSVIEQLRPSTNLKNLTIQGFGGNNFPKWLGECSSFGNMVYLKISGCRNCSCLPPLGQLGNLKELYIDEMKSVKSIGAEFYGSGSGPSFQPFPSLETLLFREMPEWEEWNLIGFPSLRWLSLKRCPKVKGDNILDNLPSLTELELNESPLLVEESGQLMLPPLTSLRKLTIRDCDSLKSFPKDGLPKTLQSLIIEDLEFLPHESLHNYTSLEDLKIFCSCYSMTYFSLGSLPVLKSLRIYGLYLRSILIGEDASQQSLSFLTSINIACCDELESFSHMGGGGFPTPNLIRFDLFLCGKLRSLPEPMNALSGLQEMSIESLPNLQSIAIDDLPISLRRLYIDKVGGGIYWNTTWEHLTCLSELKIDGNTVKELMMRTEVPLLPASLVSLTIRDLKDIESLDGKWLQHLTSLQQLHVKYAPNLKSLPEEGSLLSFLSVLRITSCPLLKSRLEKKRGKEWRKIARVPFIFIDHKIIT